MSYNSPNGSTPRAEGYYGYEDKYASPSPTPSPRGTFYYPGGQTPQRPATRAHFRGNSSSAFEFSSPRTPQFSPRYTSDGHYATATANVSSSRSSRPSRHSGFPDQRPPRRERRHSASYYRASDLYGESDEDELIEINGVTYVLPARSRTKRYQEYHINARGYDTNYRYYQQTAPSAREPFIDRNPQGYNTPRSGFDPVPERRPTAHKHSRRNSSSVPQRPQTARPSSAKPQSNPVPRARKATAKDAEIHRIPEGYSLKNWDPSEDPIMLLGSVFDANSLGKWIYDWTVYNFTGDHPISELAGELWMLLIQLAGKVKRAEVGAPKIRSHDNKDIIEDFIESGDRLSDKLRKLLKACEAPMLKSARKAKDNQLGLNAGVEFVNTLWGRDRKLLDTEKFMAAVRLWNLRFDANCEEILQSPSK